MLNRLFFKNLILIFILDSSQNQHSLTSLNPVSSTVHSVHHGALQENNSLLPGNIINKFANKGGGCNGVVVCFPFIIVIVKCNFAKILNSAGETKIYLT